MKAGDIILFVFIALAINTTAFLAKYDNDVRGRCEAEGGVLVRR